jgi:D-alanyl-lipoteichoic acid acyltransferase DltB (MBOAT superfamily)
MDTSIISNIRIDKIAEQLLYNEKNPLLFNSGFFLFAFLFFLLVYALIQNRIRARIIFIVAFSIYFYYKSSGWYFLLMIASSLVAHYLAQYIYLTRNHRKRKALMIFSVILFVSLLGYFKYTNFIIGIVNNFRTQPIQFAQLFLPLGISFYTFELISYCVDVYNRKIKPVKSIMDFCFYVSFFPHLVAGPIVRPKELIPQIYAKLKLTREDLGRGVFLIMAGLIKKAIISDYISSNFVDRIFDNPTLYSGVENLLGAYGYTLQIYCDFSGYSDMAIGIALLIGYKLPLNFDAPYQATSITEFWRKWHISLSSWLRDYLYIPLGGNRTGKFRQYINLMITMLIGGLWHGASWKFVFWGGMHGIGLAIDKLFNDVVKFKSNMFTKAVGLIITFNFVAFCWIFFRADSFETAVDLLTQVFTSFKGELFVSVITGYKQVFALILLGYLLHITPKKWDLFLENKVTRTPLIIQSVLLAIVIWMVIQCKSAELQPFIYFQF